MTDRHNAPAGRLVPETDPRVKKRKTANNWRYELECALRDFDTHDWK